MSGAPGGYMHLLPTYLPAGLTISSLTVSMLPWMSPGFSGFIGTTQEGSEPAIVVSFEWPISWVRTIDQVAKFDLEWMHLRRYSADQALATGRHAFGNIAPGSNPPDATAAVDTGSLGVEATSLTIAGRRGVHALFLELRRRLVASEPASFAKLAGHLVYVWFEEEDAPGLAQPPQRSDSQSITALLEELATYEPRSAQLWTPAGPLPQNAPELPLAATPTGTKFYALPLVASAPGTVLFSLAGFEVGLAYTTFLTAREAWEEVQRLVTKHDKPGVDLLQISASAPDAHGNIFPAEEAVAGFIVDHPLGLSQRPTYIKDVVLHSWLTGRATRLHPEVQPLFGPLYQSMVPVHHPLVPPPPTATVEGIEPS